MKSRFPSKLMLIAVAVLSLGATVRADSIQDQVLDDERFLSENDVAFFGNGGSVPVTQLAQFVPPFFTSIVVNPPFMEEGIPVDALTFGFSPFISDQLAKDFTVLWQLNVEGFSFGGFTVGDDSIHFLVPERVLFGQAMLPIGDHNNVLPGVYTNPNLRLGVSIFSDFGPQSSEGFNIAATQIIPSPTPEPGTLLLFGTGIGAVGWLRRRNLFRRKTQG